MINFDCTIYMDALSLLLSDKTNIKSEILNQLQQGDPCLESISSDLLDEASEKGLNETNVSNRFENDSCENLMEYISIDENLITFDYGESQACGDLKCVAFNIPCKFDSDRYLNKCATTKTA